MAKTLTLRPGWASTTAHLFPVVVLAVIITITSGWSGAMLSSILTAVYLAALLCAAKITVTITTPTIGHAPQPCSTGPPAQLILHLPFKSYNIPLDRITSLNVIEDYGRDFYLPGWFTTGRPDSPRGTRICVGTPLTGGQGVIITTATGRYNIVCPRRQHAQQITTMINEATAPSLPKQEAKRL